MDELVPTTGRVLRYWYGALSAACKQRLYDYLGVQPVTAVPEGGTGRSSEWTLSEVWQETEAGHESTIVLDSTDPGLAGLQIPKLRKRVKMPGNSLTQACQRRPGAILGTTFDDRRSRRQRGRPGISMISMF